MMIVLWSDKKVNKDFYRTKYFDLAYSCTGLTSASCQMLTQLFSLPLLNRAVGERVGWVRVEGEINYQLPV